MYISKTFEEAARNLYEWGGGVHQYGIEVEVGDQEIVDKHLREIFIQAGADKEKAIRDGAVYLSEVSVG